MKSAQNFGAFIVVMVVLALAGLQIYSMVQKSRDDARQRAQKFRQAFPQLPTPTIKQLTTPVTPVSQAEVARLIGNGPNAPGSVTH